MRINRVGLERFKGFEAYEHSTHDTHPGLNVYIGRNNSGKTSVLQSLYHFFTTGSPGGHLPLADAADLWFNRDTTQLVKIKVTFGLEPEDYESISKRINEPANNVREFMDSFWVEFVQSGDSRGTSGPGWEYVKDPGERLRDKFGGLLYSALDELLHSHGAARIGPLRSLALTETLQQWTAVQNNMRAGDLSNIRNVFFWLHRNVRAEFDRVKAAIEDFFKDVKILPPEHDNNLRVLVRYAVDSQEREFSSAGDGFQNALLILIAILTSGAKCVLIDEPEAHLHASLQRDLLDSLVALTDKVQIFLATHSPIYLAPRHPKGISLCENRDGSCYIRELLGFQPLAEALTDIGHRPEDVLLTRAVIFVEGRSDQEVFQAFAESLGYAVGFGEFPIIPMDGDRRLPAFAVAQTLLNLPVRMPIYFVIDAVRGITSDERKQEFLAAYKIIFPSATEDALANLHSSIHVLERGAIEHYLFTPETVSTVFGIPLGSVREAFAGAVGQSRVKVVRRLLQEASLRGGIVRYRKSRDATRLAKEASSVGIAPEIINLLAKI